MTEKAKSQTPAEREADGEIARRVRAEQAGRDTGNVQRSEVHTYADGSQRVGVPPFPAKSPKEEQVEERRAHVAMHIPAGMPTSGEKPASPVNGVTESEFKAKVEDQLQADVVSGKSPETINPTTSSDKPELVSTGVVTGHDLERTVGLGDNPTAEELDMIARQIKPEGDVSEDQVDAAVAQVARETKGPILDDKAKEEPKSSSKGKK